MDGEAFVKSMVEQRIMTDLPAIPYWIDTAGLAKTVEGASPRMAIVPCPAGGRRLEEAICDLRVQGIESLVSLLSPEEVRVLRLEEEERLCHVMSMDFRWYSVTDHAIPESMEEFRAVVEQMQRDLREGKGVGAHCFAGIGRSCMLMAGLLCAEGLSADEAFARLSAARGLPVPDTLPQAQWVGDFAESLENERRTVVRFPQRSGN
jgi:protein-tyrosine phosphatase